MVTATLPYVVVSGKKEIETMVHLFAPETDQTRCRLRSNGRVSGFRWKPVGMRRSYFEHVQLKAGVLPATPGTADTMGMRCKWTRRRIVS
jgi:hypothetical protein